MASIQHTSFSDDTSAARTGAVPIAVRTAIYNIQLHGIKSDAKYALIKCKCGCDILKKCRICMDPKTTTKVRKTCELCKDLGIDSLDNLILIRNSFNILIKFIADIDSSEIPAYLSIYQKLALSVVNKRKRHDQATLTRCEFVRDHAAAIPRINPASAAVTVYRRQHAEAGPADH